MKTTDRPAVIHDAAANLQWNFSANLLDISFITLGYSLISRDTVMPVLVSTLTDSKLAVGLISAIFGFGIYLPQLLTANYSERQSYKLPFVMRLGIGERLPFLLIAVAVWAFASTMPWLMLLLFFLFLATAAVSAGAGMPPWYDLIAKAIPVHYRGLWSGLGHGLGALMGIVGAFFVGRILNTFTYPNNYALLFLLAAIAMTISYLGLALNREAPSEGVKQRVTLASYLSKLPTVMRTNTNYSRYFASRTIVLLGTMANGFLIVYGRERFQIDGAGIGLLTAVLVASQAVMSLTLGLVGDRVGHKLVLTFGACSLSLAALLTWLAPSQLWLIPSFVLLGMFHAADSVSSLNIILEFCEPQDRPTYIGLTNTLLAPIVVLAPMVGASLAAVLGYPTLLITAVAVAGLGAVMLAWWVVEPRHHQRGEGMAQ